MGRILALALVLYGYGDPGFDGHRPDALDRPLHNFHRGVDISASRLQRILVGADDGTGDRAALAKLGDKLRKIGTALAPAAN